MPDSIKIGPAEHKCRCNSSILLYTHAQAKNYCCTACGAYYRSADGSLTFIDKKAKPGNAGYIAIGTKGKMDDTDYVVVAYVVKKDSSYNFRWAEYTLFNPVVGYCYLSVYDGHWMFLSHINYVAVLDKYTTEITHKSLQYRLYSKYNCKVEEAVGEFHFDVYSSNKLKYHEFINPPEILVQEYAPSEMVWLHGRYIQPAEVQKAFNCKELPARRGIGVIQPQSFSLPYRQVLRATLLVGSLLLCLQLIFSYNSAEKLVFTHSGTAESPARTVVSPSFELTGTSKNLQYALYAEVSNTWLETDITLINEKTGEDFDMEVGTEFYSGYEGGESWTEGSRSATKIIDAVPAGRYHLLITPIKDIGVAQINYSIELKRDVPRWANLIYALLLLAIFPVVQSYRETSFEKERWMESNYSPFENDDEDE